MNESYESKYISVENCRHGWSYRLDARNSSVGIYNQNRKEFVILRIKFRDEYLDSEKHWDLGAPHGTAKPLEELEYFMDVPEGWGRDSSFYNEAVLYLENLKKKIAVQDIFCTNKKKIRKIGLEKGKFSVPSEFFEDLPDDVIDSFYEGDIFPKKKE